MADAESVRAVRPQVDIPGGRGAEILQAVPSRPDDEPYRRMAGLEKQMITQCCVCKRYERADHDLWTSDLDLLSRDQLADIVRKNVSHGYCPPCNASERKRFGLKPANNGSLPPSLS